MHIATSRSGLAMTLGVATLGLLFSACRPKPPESPPAPVPPAPEVAAPATPGVAPSDATATGASVSSMDPAAPDAEPAPRAAAAREPALAAMKLAVRESAKIGVPVDLHYQVGGPAEPGRPVTVHLAAVPRVAGSNLSVSIKDTAGLEAVVAPLAMQKASAGTAYRQQMAVTRTADGPAELRVLVTMETPEGSAFSWFGVPLAP